MFFSQANTFLFCNKLHKLRFLTFLVGLCSLTLIQHSLFANPTCYGGGGLGVVKQKLYSPEYNTEGQVITVRTTLGTIDDIGGTAFVGCSVNDSTDVEVGVLINKGAKFTDKDSEQSFTINQRAVVVDGVFKAPAFENGLQIYGKFGYGFFMSFAAERRLIDQIPQVIATANNSFKNHAAVGVAYPITDEMKIRAEYHRFPKANYTATPIMINLTYQFD